jgi:hypothetical protein
VGEVPEKIDKRTLRKKSGGPGGMVRLYRNTRERLDAYCQRTGERITDVVDAAVQAWLNIKERK